MCTRHSKSKPRRGVSRPQDLKTDESRSTPHPWQLGLSYVDDHEPKGVILRNSITLWVELRRNFLFIRALMRGSVRGRTVSVLQMIKLHCYNTLSIYNLTAIMEIVEKLFKVATTNKAIINKPDSVPARCCPLVGQFEYTPRCQICSAPC